MVDMDSDHILVVPDTPDRLQQSTCPVSSPLTRRDVDPSPRRRFRFKTRNNSMHAPSYQADAFSVLPAHTDADNIFRQADVARTLSVPEDSESKSPSQKSNKTTGTSLLNKKRAGKRVLDQSSSISINISSSEAGERRHSCQIRDGEVSQQGTNHQTANSLVAGSGLPTIPVGKLRNGTGISVPNRLKSVGGPGVCPVSSSEVKDEMITDVIIAGSASPPSVVHQRHVGQKRLVRNGYISPSNIAKRSVKVDERQEMCSPSVVLHHQHPQRDVFGRANVIDLTDNSRTITRHGSAVNISENIMDTRAAKTLKTERAGEALAPPSEYLANGSSSYGVSLSGHDNKGKEICHDMLDSKWIGEANSRRVCINSAGASSVANSSSSCVNPEQGWRTTRNHTSKLLISSMGKTASSSGQESGSSAPYDLDHGSAEGTNATSEPTTIRNERLVNRTLRIARGRRKHALSYSHSGESSSALDEPRSSFIASSETTVGGYHTGRRHNIPVISIDDVLPVPEVRPSSSGCNDGTSVDPTIQAQLEADELLARQLQEQLYNETSSVVTTEDIEAVIAMSLEHEENAYHTSRAVRRRQYNTRGTQGSRSNAYQNAAARSNNMISRLHGSVTSGLGAVFHRYPGAPHTQPNIDLNDYDALLALDENNHQHTGASESQINSLPQSVVQSNSIEDPCAVCLENPSVGDAIRHLPCFHKFHKECIDEWLRRKKLCPICKSGIR